MKNQSNSKRYYVAVVLLALTLGLSVGCAKKMASEDNPAAMKQHEPWHPLQASKRAFHKLGSMIHFSKKVAAVDNPVIVDHREYWRMFQASKQVLHGQGFILDRQDYRFGVINTKPRISPTAIEFWYPDNRTRYQSAESTLNKQQRLVTVTLEPLVNPNDPITQKPAKQFQLRVEAVIQQLQEPAQYMSGSVRGEAILKKLRQTPTELAQQGIKKQYWQSIGRDPHLEQRLLAMIVRESLKIALPDELNKNAGAALLIEPKSGLPRSLKPLADDQ